MMNESMTQATVNYRAMGNRKQGFDRIKNAIERDLVLSSNAALVCEGDSLEMLRRFPDECLSL
ncbi:MAG TPA: hypothetical protein VGN42_26740, partial [Pirellulales bacterium]|nr:hypothetical protein [Pirellulales bacterium]